MNKEETDNKTALTIRVRKTTRAFCTNVSLRTYVELRNIATRNKLSLAKVVDLALEDFVSKHGGNMNEMDERTISN